MLNCPHCHVDVRLNEIPHPGFFKDYRICPNCGGRFTPDPQTKRSQAKALVVAIVALVLTVLLYVDGTGWLIPSLVSYGVLGLIVYRGNRRIYLVPYPHDRGRSGDA